MAPALRLESACVSCTESPTLPLIQSVHALVIVIGFTTGSMFSIKQAAEQVGISETLLMTWIESKRVKPSVELSTAKSDVFDKYPSLKHYAVEGELWGWSRYAFSDEDVKKLRRTAKRFKEWKDGTREVESYTTADLAEEWNLSTDTIRKLFEAEPGVLKIGDSNP